MIDWTQVKQLKEDVGLEDLAEVIEVFIDEVDTAMDALRLLDKPDATTLEMQLHFLKGCAVNLGFSQFANVCAMGENHARDGRLNAVDLAQLTPLYQASLSDFLSQLPTEVGITLGG